MTVFRPLWPVLCAVLAVPALAVPAATAEPAAATATFHDIEGKQVGTARLTQTPNGVLIDLDLTGVAPGEHAFHVHAKGDCDAATKFDSAGGHFTGGEHTHGYLTEGGPHAGDMPNLFVPENGVLKAQVFNPNVALDDSAKGLLDADGSALMIHAGVDDYTTQPTGNAGGRFACAAIGKP